MKPNAKKSGFYLQIPEDVSVCGPQVIALRRERRIYDRIAEQTGVSHSTVGRILERHGLNRWRDLEPAEPVIRYERERPGEIIHMDIKKLGKFDRVGHRITGDRHGQSSARGIGWEFVHVSIDDHSRLAFSQVLKSEKKECARTRVNSPSPACSMRLIDFFFGWPGSRP